MYTFQGEQARLFVDACLSDPKILDILHVLRHLEHLMVLLPFTLKLKYKRINVYDKRINGSRPRCNFCRTIIDTNIGETQGRNYRHRTRYRTP